MLLRKYTICGVAVLLCLSASAQQVTQTIRGVVVDKESKTILVGANVIILETNPLIGTSTDVKGKFKLSNVPIGRYDIKVSFIGYNDVIIPELLIGSAKEVVLTIEMTESAVKMEQVTISAQKSKGSPLNEMATISARSFSVEETKRYAASVNDPGRMIISFAGVSNNSDLRNDIVVRGNTPRGMLWRIEGIEIPNPNHFGGEDASGGGISMLSAQVINNSDFSSGAFPAEYGNAISGVFDIKLRKGNNEKHEYAFQSGVYGIDFAAEGPFSKKADASYLANYRYSTLAILNKLGVKIIGDQTPVFQDLSFNVNIPTKKTGIFSIWGLGGLSRSILKTDKDSTLWKTNSDRYSSDYMYNMGVAGIANTYFMNEKAFIKTIISFGVNETNYLSDSLTDNYLPFMFEKYNYVSYYARGSVLFNKKINAKNTFRTGIIFSNIRFNLSSTAYEPALLKYVVHLNNKGNTNYLQSYFQWKYRLNNNLTINPGMHYSHFMLNNSHSVEPRLGISMKLSALHTLSAGYGIHTKLESMTTYFAQQQLSDDIYMNKQLKPTKAQHLVLGYEWILSERLTLKLETYYQHLVDVAVDDTASSFSILNVSDGYIANKLVNEGTGRNYGIELTLERAFSKHFYYLYTLSLFQSRYTGSDGVERNTRFNTNYVINLLAGKEFKIKDNNLFGTNIRSTYAGGRRYIPLDLNKSIQAGEAIYLYELAYSQRMNDYYRIDIGINYRINNPKASHIISLDVQNVTNRLNAYNQHYDAEKKKVVTTTEYGRIPIISYKIEF